MKRFILLVVVALTFGLLSNSYALPNFWYVGVGSNLSGQLTPNTSVNVKITVKQNGLTVFQESHAAVMTDDFSIFAVEVGNGTPITGTLGALTMTANTQFLCEVSVPPAAYKTIATTSLAYLYSTLIIVPGAISITQDNILMGDPMNNAADVPVGGDLTATYNAGTADFQIAAGAIVNADVNAAAAIDVTKLAAGAANQFLVNNGTNAWAGLNLSGNFVGDAVGTALDLSNTGVTPGTYGSASNVSQITVDAFGRITAANDVAIIESDPEVNMTTVNAVPVWNGTALVDGNITDDGIVVDLNGRDLNTTGTIYAGAGDYTGNVEALTLTQNGNAVVDVTTAFGGDVTGTIGATVVGDDSHNHTDATIADALTINGGTINNSPIGATTPSTGAFTTLTQGGNNVVDVTTAFGGDVTGTIGATVVGNDSHNHTDATIADALTIDGGTIDNSPIGATTPSTGAFTNLTATGTVTLPANSITDAMVVDALTINGGTINNTPIGATTPSTGAFTNLTATGTVTLPANSITDAMVVDALTINGGTVDATPIGGTTPSTGAFTTLTQGGNNVVDVTTAFGGDVTGTIGATVVGDDSHNHTDATIADALTINGGTINNTPIGATTPSTGAFTTLTQGGNNVVDVTTAFGGDVTGTIGATVVGDDSHNHTDATIADALTINGGTINNSPIGATTPSTGAFTTLTQGGNNVVDVTTAFVGDVTGTIGATVVGDDSHNHTDATIADNLTINGGTVSNSTITVADNVFTIQDNGDNTKQAQFELSGITTATTRTYTLPDANGTILLNGDIGVTVQPYNANTTILGSDIDLTSEVTGTLPIANGGTGATTANAALNNLLPTQAGNAGEFLTTDGTNTSWAPLTVTLQAAYDGGNTITGTNTIAITNSDAINTAVGISSNNTGATSGYALNVGHAGNRPAARVYYAGLGNASQTAPVLVVDQGNPATGIKVNLNDNNLTDASGGSYGVDIVYNPGDASNTGAGIRVVVGDALNGIDVDAQGTGLAINVVDEGGAVKLSYASNNATTIPNDVSVYHSTINSNSTITMPSGTNGKFLYVVHTGAGNLTFSGVKTDGTNYTTTDEANLTFVYAGGAWQLVSVVE